MERAAGPWNDPSSHMGEATAAASVQRHTGLRASVFQARLVFTRSQANRLFSQDSLIGVCYLHSTSMLVQDQEAET